MTQMTISANEIQQFVLRFFGGKRITAITAGNTVVLTSEEAQQLEEPKQNSHSLALNELCGMFKNTGLLSSDDFAKNKIIEKKLEDEKFKHE